MFVILDVAIKLCDLWLSDGIEGLLALNFYNVVKPQLVFVGDDIYASIASRLCNSAMKAHSLKQVCDEVFELTK